MQQHCMPTWSPSFAKLLGLFVFITSANVDGAIFLKINQIRERCPERLAEAKIFKSLDEVPHITITSSIAYKSVNGRPECEPSEQYILNINPKYFREEYGVKRKLIILLDYSSKKENVLSEISFLEKETSLWECKNTKSRSIFGIKKYDYYIGSDAKIIKHNENDIYSIISCDNSMCKTWFLSKSYNFFYRLDRSSLCSVYSINEKIRIELEEYLKEDN